MTMGIHEVGKGLQMTEGHLLSLSGVPNDIRMWASVGPTDSYTGPPPVSFSREQGEALARYVRQVVRSPRPGVWASGFITGRRLSAPMDRLLEGAEYFVDAFLPGQGQFASTIDDYARIPLEKRDGTGWGSFFLPGGGVFAEVAALHERLHKAELQRSGQQDERFLSSSSVRGVVNSFLRQVRELSFSPQPLTVLNRDQLEALKSIIAEITWLPNHQHVGRNLDIGREGWFKYFRYDKFKCVVDGVIALLEGFLPGSEALAAIKKLKKLPIHFEYFRRVVDTADVDPLIKAAMDDIDRRLEALPASVAEGVAQGKAAAVG